MSHFGICCYKTSRQPSLSFELPYFQTYTQKSSQHLNLSYGVTLLHTPPASTELFDTLMWAFKKKKLFTH